MKTCLFLLLLLSFVSHKAEAAPAEQKRVLISVGDFVDNQSKAWKKDICQKVHTLSNQILDHGARVVCREFSTDNFLDPEIGSLNQQYDYHLRITRSKDESLILDISNWNRKHNSDFTTLGWNLKNSEKSKVKQEDAFAKIIGNIFLYANNELAYKAGLLVHGAKESDEIEFDESKGIFRDKKTNTVLSINKAMSIYENESPRKRNYLRTGIEIGIQLSAAMAIYYKNLVFNQVDFDYSLKSGLKGKLVTGEAIKFDDNDKFSNYGHIYAGVMYYQTARSNGFTSLESALITFASSAAWEFLEYHEIFSINDQILTPIGGYVIGEATYQIACALVTKNSIAAKTLGYAINPNLAINHALDAGFKKDRFAAQPDCKKPRWSDISVHIGLDKGQKAYEPGKNKDYTLGMSAEVINIEDYNKEGRAGKVVLDTSMVKMIVENNGNQGLMDLKVVAQVVMAAYHQKNLQKDESGSLRGYEVVLGLGSASTWIDRGGEEGSKTEDFYGTINILGTTAHANIHFNGFNIRADLGVYGDFAMVKGYAVESIRDSRSGNKEGESSILTRKNYYWGVGASTLMAITASKGRFEVGYVGQHSTARSINERNRVEATNGDVFRDSIHMNKIFINYKLTKSLKLQLAREYNVRKGSANREFHTEGVETRTTGTLIYKF